MKTGTGKRPTTIHRFTINFTNAFQGTWQVWQCVKNESKVKLIFTFRSVKMCHTKSHCVIPVVVSFFLFLSSRCERGTNSISVYIVKMWNPHAENTIIYKEYGVITSMRSCNIYEFLLSLCHRHRSQRFVHFFILFYVDKRSKGKPNERACFN